MKFSTLSVPKSVSNVPDEMLIPKNTWEDKADYDATAKKLADKFSAHFDKAYGTHGLSEAIVKACPGK
jgi:phosphoenolpyruvate carboxykinase (ATP)